MSTIENFHYPKIFAGENISIYDISADYQGIGFATWGGFIKIDDPTRLYELERTIENVKNNHIKVYISDCRHLKVSPDVLVDWIHEVWYPRCYAHGLRYEVVVEAENILGQIGLSNMVSQSGNVKIIRVKKLSQAFAEAQKALEEEKIEELIKKLGF